MDAQIRLSPARHDLSSRKNKDLENSSFKQYQIINVQTGQNNQQSVEAALTSRIAELDNIMKSGKSISQRKDTQAQEVEVHSFQRQTTLHLLDRKVSE